MAHLPTPLFQLPGRLYAVASFLNVQVVLGALAGLHASARLLGVQVQPLHYWLLALATATVYMADRLADVARPGHPVTLRHSYYQRNFKGLCVLAGGMAAVGLVLGLWWLTWRMALFGLAMAALVLIYLWLVARLKTNRPLWLGKETWVALLYTLAVWLPPAIEHQVQPGWAHLLAMAGAALAAWQNLWFMYWMEPEDGPPARRILAGRMVFYCILAALPVLAALVIAQVPAPRTALVLACILAGQQVLKLAFPAWGNVPHTRRLADSLFILLWLV